MTRADSTGASGDIKWCRRDVVVSALAAAGASACAGVEVPATVETRLRADIDRFVQFGTHRSGTPGEAATATWMAGRLRTLGYAARADAFPIRTVADPAAAVVVGGQTFEAFPQWRATRTEEPESVSGALIRLDDAALEAGAIAIAPEPAPLSAYWTAAHDAYVDRARAAGVLALVMAVDDRTGGLFVCNRDSAEPDFPLPAILVSLATLRELVSRAAHGATAKVRCAGVPVSAQSFNVVARKPGAGKAIVISTPLTGWFQCGAERGPGIALALELADRLRATQRPVMVIGTGSHETGHLGMARALLHDAPSPTETAVWLHLGAGIAATALDGQFGLASPQWVISTPAARTLADDLVAVQGFSPLPGRADAPGEGGQVIKYGHERVVALAGVFPGFHTSGDDGRAVDTAKLARVLGALNAVVASVDV